jgi:hypothetical protein
MERAEILKELRMLHDAMVYGTSIIPGRKLIQAVYEAAELLESEAEIIVEV